MAKKSTTKKATRKKEDPNLQNILSQLNELRMGLYDLRSSLRDHGADWGPRVGDIVAVTHEGSKYFKFGEVCKVMSEGSMAGFVGVQSFNPTYLHGGWQIYRKWLRPATEQEKATAHIAANSHPQRVEVEPWKPKVGDYVWITGPTAGGDLSLVNTLATVKIFFGEDDSVGTDKHSEWHPRSSYRKPSEEDITLYKQEEEARLKKEKEEIPFGKPVKWGAAPLFGEDLRAKAIYLGRCADGTYTIATEKHGGGFMQHNVKRDEFTIEEP